MTGAARIVRIAAAFAACVTVALVTSRSLLGRYSCSVEKKRTESWLDGARHGVLPERQAAVARAAIPRLMRCVEHDPADYESLFLLAVARRDAGQSDGALRTFEAALQLNERPETHLNLGVLHLEAGRLDRAREHLLRAAAFNIVVTGDLDMPFAHELYAEVLKRQERLRNRAR